MNKLLFALSMARRSGNMVCGFEPVKEAVLKDNRHIVILAADTGENTSKKVKYFCEDKVHVYTTELTQFDISQVAGRLTGVVAVTDENLSILCKNALK